MFHVLELRDFPKISRSGASCISSCQIHGVDLREFHTLKQNSGFTVVKCKVCMLKANIVFHTGKTTILHAGSAHSVGELTPEREPKSTPPGSGEPLG